MSREFPLNIPLALLSQFYRTYYYYKKGVLGGVENFRYLFKS